MGISASGKDSVNSHVLPRLILAFFTFCLVFNQFFCTVQKASKIGQFVNFVFLQQDTNML